MVKTVMQLRQLDKQLCFSQQWVTDFAFQVLMLAKKEPRPSDEPAPNHHKGDRHLCGGWGRFVSICNR